MEMPVLKVLTLLLKAILVLDTKIDALQTEITTMISHKILVLSSNGREQQQAIAKGKTRKNTGSRSNKSTDFHTGD